MLSISLNEDQGKRDTEMTKYTIRTVGNRALYRDLYESIDEETTHRTASGAAARLIALSRKARKWANSMGAWGTIEIEIDGKALDTMDTTGIFADADEAAFGYDSDRSRAKARIINTLTA